MVVHDTSQSFDNISVSTSVDVVAAPIEVILSRGADLEELEVVTGAEEVSGSMFWYGGSVCFLD